ncbi:MAG: 4Fe-4S binding protein, partial [Clostridia bacterium]
DAIEINRAEKTWSIVRARCVQCNSCVEVCPKACITMHPEYTPVMCEKETEVCHARVADNEADN